MKRGGGFKRPDPEEAAAKRRKAQERAAERARERAADPAAIAKKRAQAQAARERAAARRRERRALERADMDARADAGLLLPRETRPRQKPRVSPSKQRRRAGRRSTPVAPGKRRDDWYSGDLVCAVCGNPRITRHHVTYEQEVRNRRGFIFDPANRLPLCHAHHAGHHANDPLPLSIIPDAALEFAFELMGRYAYDYLRARYRGRDRRVDALLHRPEPVDLHVQHDSAAESSGNEEENDDHGS
jgi:hypothetical protein